MASSAALPTRRALASPATVLANVVRTFLSEQGVQLDDHDARLEAFTRALDTSEASDPLRLVLDTFRDLPVSHMGALVQLAKAMDAVVAPNVPQPQPQQQQEQQPPTSNESSSSGTGEERDAKIVGKWQAQVNAVVQDIFGAKAVHEITIKRTTTSSFDLVRGVYRKEAGLSLDEWDMMQQRLNEIDAAMLKKLDKLSKVLPAIEAAFVAPYCGRAPDRLLNYLWACWEVYRNKENSAAMDAKSKRPPYRYPYCAIVQSSGFGKSRLLRELAVKTDAVNRSGSMRMHVLYACVRNLENSTGYPRRTECVSGYLFPLDLNKENTDEMEQGLAQRLLRVFLFVMRAEWEARSDLLLDLFSGDEGDYQTAFTSFKESLTDADCGVSPEGNTVPWRLVLAIDEARTLLPKKDEKGIGWFRVLRRALARVNDMIAVKCGSPSGVFGIVIDTNSKVADFVPAAIQDPSYRPEDKFSLFPPFVLTETVDIFHASGKRKIEQYEEDVLRAVRPTCRENRTGWEALCSLGRPLWKTVSVPPRADGQPSTKPPDREDVTIFAARKLLMSEPEDDFASLNDATMNGVASLLCRIGLRPYSSSPLASRAVADFMAVLSSVGYDRDHYISSYSSDPILTLGAARIWHAIEPRPLAVKILPELRKMMHQELVDTGNVGEMVARIVLLLAMDACGVLETGREIARWNRVGEFCSVWTLLSALHGGSPKLKIATNRIRLSKRTRATRRSKCVDVSPRASAKALDVMKANWIDWFVSFTHFVQLTEHPTKDCLWAMLARRAAGAFHRGQKGVDLVIPICTSTFDEDGNPVTPRVSMILVRVKNCESRDKAFPKSATESMRPSVVFKKGNKVRAQEKAFQALSPASVIRVYMSMHARKTDRFYLVDQPPGSPPSYVLCLMGLSPWESLPDDDVRIEVKSAAHGDAHTAQGSDSHMSNSAENAVDREGAADQPMETIATKPVEILSDGVAKQLKAMLRPWWKVAALVEEDLKARGDVKVFGSSRKSLQHFATLPLAETLLLNNGQRTRSRPSRLGRTVVLSSAPPSGTRLPRESSGDASGRGPKKPKSK